MIAKRVLFFNTIAFALLLTSCGGSDGSVSENDTHENISPGEVLYEFKNCKASSEGPAVCKGYAAMAVCGNYEISDFYDPENGYWDYDEIVEKIGDLDNWEHAGTGDDQEALDRAQEAANNGKAAIAVSLEDGKENVAVIVAGEQKASGSWGVKCPTVAFFFPNRPDDSFIDKTLNYAFTDPDEVEIYIRKYEE